MSQLPASRDANRQSWRVRPEAAQPTVLVLGGFLTSPVMYRRFVSRLRDRGAAGVVLAPVWLPDWMLAVSRGLEAVTLRAARALLAAGALSERVSDAAPVLVVGHSAGGMVARLLTAPEPFSGRRLGAAPRIGAIVTLGSPHVVARSGGIGRRVHVVAASLADASVPGSFFAPLTGYLSVASRSIVANPSGDGRQRVAAELYRSLLGPREGAGSEGDGLVPVASALLPGAAHVVLEEAVHGPGSGRPWYGSDDQVDLWWPQAVETWRQALVCRSSRALPDQSRSPADAHSVGALSADALEEAV